MNLDAPALALVDLWGNSHNATHNRAVYRDNIGKFSDALKRHSDGIPSGELKTVFLHDSAYIGTKTLRVLVTYLRAVREELLKRNLYLQAAIISPGSLDPSFFRYPTQEDEQASVEGFELGEDVPEVYSAHYALKSIAIRTEYPDKFPEFKKELKDAFVVSCHFPNQSTKVEVFLDIRFSRESLTSTLIKNVLIDCLRFRARARGTWKYFLPLLITIVRSVEWRNVKSEQISKDADRPTKLTVERELLNWLKEGPFNEQFGYIPGTELLYFSLLDEIHKSKSKNPELYDEILQYIIKRRRFLTNLDRIPEEIMAHSIRDTIIEGRFTSKTGEPKPEQKIS